MMITRAGCRPSSKIFTPRNCGPERPRTARRGRTYGPRRSESEPISLPCIVAAVLILAVSSLVSAAYAQDAVKDASKDTEHATTKAAKTTAHATDKAAVKTADTGKDAAKDTEHGTKKVVHKTANATDKAASKTATAGKDVGKGTEKAAKATGHEVKKGVEDVGHEAEKVK